MLFAMEVHSPFEVRLRQTLLIALSAIVLCVTGCQQTPSTVSGAVTQDGKPLEVAGDSRGTIVFQPMSGQGTSANGLLDSAGHFKLTSGASLAIAPGKYQVAISVVQLLPRSESGEAGAKRLTPAKYASASTSGLEAEVKQTANEFTFDIKSTADMGTEDAAATGGQSGIDESAVPKEN